MTISGNSLHFRARADFWYETTFTIPEEADPQQLHATIIKDSSAQQVDIGRVVVALFEVTGTTLTLGVVDDFDEPPANPIDSDWDWVTDLYHFERALAPSNRTAN